MISLSNQMHDRIFEILGKRLKLPVMPVTGIKLMQLVQRPTEELEIQEITSLVEQDPVLTARILRIANSPAYGTLRTVTGVRQALVTIGMEESIAALNYFLMRKLIPPIPRLPYFNPQAFWQHSVACAATARMLGNPNFNVKSFPGELYLAGLLHDIGKLMLAVHFPVEFGKCLLRANEFTLPLHLVEREIIVVNHALLGAHLLDEWHVPHRILNAVCHHHSPFENEEDHEMALLVHLADLLVTTASLGNSGNPVPAHPEDSIALRSELGSLSIDHGWQQFQVDVAQRLAIQASTYDEDHAPAPAKRRHTVYDSNAELLSGIASKPLSRWQKLLRWLGR